MNRILRLIFTGIISFALVKASMYGWRFRQVHTDWSKVMTGQGIEQRLRDHVYVLSHNIGDRSLFEYKNLMRAEEYIRQELSSYGYQVELERYPVWNMSSANIVAFKKGNSFPEEIVILGAHYDTCSNPGADDNASGVAGVLEIARLLSMETMPRTLRFVFFTNEEPPLFKTENMGSRVHAVGSAARKEDIRSAVILEMIGCYSNLTGSQKYPPLFGMFYPSRGDYIAVIGNFASRRLVRDVKKSFREHSSFPVESLVSAGIVPGVDFSDHWSFWKEGYPAVMITDTAFYRYPHYHKASDTHDKLDYNSMAEVVRALSGVMRYLCE